MADILDTIAESNREIVRKNKEIKPMTKVMDEAFACGRGDLAFEKALAKEGLSFICECKKASPSKGIISEDFPYLDIAKDIVYIDKQDGHKRRSMQTVMYEIAVGLTKLMTPVLPHTTEEIWGFLHEPEEFVQLTDIPEPKKYDHDSEILANWTKFRSYRDDVLKVLEEARDAKKIGKSSEAALTIYATSEVADLMDSLQTDLATVLMVSQLTMKDFADAPDDSTKFDSDGLALSVEPAEGKTCERCRLVRQDVGADSDYPTFCQSCAQIVRDQFPETATEGFEEK